MGALLRDQPGIDVLLGLGPNDVDWELPSMKIEDAPLHVELPAEQRRATPPVLRDGAFSTNVEAHGVPAAVARTLPDLAIAASTNEVQGTGTEEILVVVASLLVREVRTGG